MKRFSTSQPARHGFSLVELMVAIGIIGILVAILIPTVARVRRSAQTASTQALLGKLQSAIEQYRQDHNAYPGPLADSDIGPQPAPPYTPFDLIVTPAAGFYTPSGNKIVQDIAGVIPAYNVVNSFDGSITGTNNLVLGLYGGLYYLTTATAGTPHVRYDPSRVGKGPSTLNPAALKNQPAYIEESDLSWNTQNGLKTGRFAPDGITYDPANPTGMRSLLAADSIIPSILDRYTDRLPLLYLRARGGSPAVAGFQGKYPYSTASGAKTITAEYDLAHVIPYTSSTIGNVSKLVTQRSPATEQDGLVHGLRRIFSVEAINRIAAFQGKQSTSGTPNSVYVYPYDLELYLTSPNSSTTSAAAGPGGNFYYQTTPRVKGSFILISAGPDRIYGTNDDITSFGQVAP